MSRFRFRNKNKNKIKPIDYAFGTLKHNYEELTSTEPWKKIKYSTL